MPNEGIVHHCQTYRMSKLTLSVIYQSRNINQPSLKRTNSRNTNEHTKHSPYKRLVTLFLNLKMTGTINRQMLSNRFTVCSMRHEFFSLIPI